MKHIQPILGIKSFHCPNCGVLSEQTWSSNINCGFHGRLPNGGSGHTIFSLKETMIAKCTHCEQVSIWIDKKMVHPMTGNVEMANPDLPVDIKKDYNEAKNIVNISPRGAAALLRLAVQKLCIHLGEKGLPSTMQQALDSVRVVGNNAVHPGVIDFEDNTDTAFALFGFVNVICEVLISQPKKIEEYYMKNIPEGVRKKIEERDNK